MNETKGDTDDSDNSGNCSRGKGEEISQVVVSYNGCS